MEEQITELLKRINEASPVVWEAATRQVQIDLVFNVILFIWIFIQTAGGAFILYRTYGRYKDEDFLDTPDFVHISSIVIGVMVVVGIFILPTILHNVLSLALNPEWEAIRLILRGK